MTTTNPHESTTRCEDAPAPAGTRSVRPDEPTPPLVQVELDRLRAHPANSNVMSEALLKKLAGHIERTGRYPPLIVRPAPGEPRARQVLDGHHRWRALERLGHRSAMCMLWDVDDEQALVLLATLNRLEGADDPHRRSRLLGELVDRYGRSAAELARLVPETAQRLNKLAVLRRPCPAPSPPPSLEDMPRAVHFFLLPADRRRLESVLRRIGGSREQALMTLIERNRADAQDPVAQDTSP
jgi:ParB-like chromosome segregation protein Spo0J